MHAMHGPFCQRTDLRKTDIHAGENTHGMHAAARHWQRVPSTAIRCCPSRIGGSASRRIAMDMHDVAMGGLASTTTSSVFAPRKETPAAQQGQQHARSSFIQVLAPATAIGHIHATSTLCELKDLLSVHSPSLPCPAIVATRKRGRRSHPGSLWRRRNSTFGG